jgi:hypothetical protein
MLILAQLFIIFSDMSCAVTFRAQAFVEMLPKNVTDAEMTDLFSQNGNIKDLQILRGSQQASKGTFIL